MIVVEHTDVCVDVDSWRDAGECIQRPAMQTGSVWSSVWDWCVWSRICSQHWWHQMSEGEWLVTCMMTPAVLPWPCVASGCYTLAPTHFLTRWHKRSLKQVLHPLGLVSAKRLVWGKLGLCTSQVIGCLARWSLKLPVVCWVGR